MENKPLVYQLIPKLMEEIGAIGKDRKNPLGFKYRGIEDALNNMHPHLVKLGLTVEIRCHCFHVESFVEKGKEKDRLQFHSTLLMDVTFVAPDGSRSERTAAGEGLDTAGDKATNKAMAAAFKYAVFLGLCLPVEDGGLDDPDQHGRKQQDTQTQAPAAPVLPSIPGPAPTVLGNTASPSVQARTQTVLQLVESLQMPPEVLQALVAKRGVSRLSELSVTSLDEIIAQLKKLQTEQQAEQTFSKG